MHITMITMARNTIIVETNDHINRMAVYFLLHNSSQQITVPNFSKTILDIWMIQDIYLLWRNLRGCSSQVELLFSSIPHAIILPVDMHNMCTLCPFEVR
nr:hypothetical protein Iba_chr06aCG20720 [Ipomoea batatas]